MIEDSREEPLITPENPTEIATGNNSRVWHLTGFTVALFSQNITDVSHSSIDCTRYSTCKLQAVTNTVT